MTSRNDHATQIPVIRYPHKEACGYCGTIHEISSLPAPGEIDECARCHLRLEHRKEFEIRRAKAHDWAGWGLALLLPALFLTMMKTVEPLTGRTTHSGLVIGVAALWTHGDRLLALLIGGFSGVFPTLKLCGMWWITREEFSLAPHGRFVHWMVEKTEKLGMVEPFLIALMLVVFKLSAVMQLTVEIGMYCFVAMVVCNFMATYYFDARAFRDPSQYTRS